MPDLTSYHRSFSGGELTSEFFGQVTDSKYQTGLALCENFVVMPHGPITNRAGFKFVRQTKHTDKKARLISFYFAFNQTLILEFGDLYMRVHTLGQTVLDGGVPYELVTPFTQSQVGALRFIQSGDVVTFVHPDHPPKELKRLGAINWTLTDIAFGSLLAAPGGVTATPTPGATPGTPFDTEYVVTALTDSGDESLQSATVTASNNLFDDNAYNTVAWAAVAGATRYNLYKKFGGLFGYIGQTPSLNFKDDNIAPDPGRTPPLDISLFESADNYPRACAYYDQRRGFGSTETQPQNVWLSKAGTETNFNYSIPKQDADSLQFKIASRGGDGILDMVDLEDLVLTTPGGVWRVNGGPTELVLPDTLSARKVLGLEAGAADVTPVVAGAMLYVSAIGGHVREFGYSGERGGYRSGDVSLRAPHLFDGHLITRLAYQPSPVPVVWAVSTSGELLGFTYVPEEQVGAWHRHTTQGVFEDAAVAIENGMSVLYALVKRELNGVEVRTVERMEPFFTRLFNDPTSPYFLDCGGTFDTNLDGDGNPVSAVSGLGWLEGEEVGVVADGAYVGTQIVTEGAITLPYGVEASVIHFGLEYAARAKTLPLALEVTAYGHFLTKNINKVLLKLSRSYPPKVGPSFERLREAKVRTTETMGSPTALQTGLVEVVLDAEWQDEAVICVEQSAPLPCTLLSFALDMAIGGA